MVVVKFARGQRRGVLVSRRVIRRNRGISVENASSGATMSSSFVSHLCMVCTSGSAKVRVTRRCGASDMIHIVPLIQRRSLNFIANDALPACSRPRLNFRRCLRPPFLRCVGLTQLGNRTARRGRRRTLRLSRHASRAY